MICDLYDLYHLYDLDRDMYEARTIMRTNARLSYALRKVERTREVFSTPPHPLPRPKQTSCVTSATPTPPLTTIKYSACTSDPVCHHWEFHHHRKGAQGGGRMPGSEAG